MVAGAPTEEEKTAIRAKRAKAAARFDRLAAAAEILQQIIDTDAAELATVLAGADGGIVGFQKQIEGFRSVAWKANAKLREAAAIAQMRAAAVEVNPDAAAEPATEPAAAEVEAEVEADELEECARCRTATAHTEQDCGTCGPVTACTSCDVCPKCGDFTADPADTAADVAAA
ncbi:hypothetical protein [Nonomuraea salmonea]|uniref:hypothetical protein n=1 Tax=Nonomuraea salmonea TaxID=46181 RepID=UPI002FED59A8